LEQKNANIFTKFFGENIFKMTTSVPGFTGFKREQGDPIAG
jgi:hypothetical protein